MIMAILLPTCILLFYHKISLSKKQGYFHEISEINEIR